MDQGSGGPPVGPTPGRRELLAPHIHRPLAAPVAALLSRTRVSADLVTVAAFGTSLVAALLFTAGRPALTVSAGLVLFAGTVLDCADGALARLRGTSSVRGAWLDTMLDKVADAAVAIAVTAAFARDHPSPWIWVAGTWSLTASILASYGRKERQLHDRGAPESILDRLSRRDVRTSVLVVGAVVAQPFPALLVTGAAGTLALAGGFVPPVRP